MADDLFEKATDFLKGNRPWYTLPKLLAVPKLIQMRNDLRQKNLHDTEEPPMPLRGPSDPIPPEVLNSRTYDGTWNDLGCPHMGAAGRRFGRNFPLEHTHPDTANLMTPNPRDVSLKLLTRTEFQPVTILNLLAAAWIQFMVHDWFAHKTSPTETLDVPLAGTDPWPDHPMKIPATVPDPAPAGSTHPPAYTNENSHWWDGSQIYGDVPEVAAKLRTGVDGKLKLSSTGQLLVDAQTGLELTGFNDNLWIGLNILHALFTAEHNAICDMLKTHYPSWTDEQLFDKARLINAALLAKIHTVEWTPAILPHPTIQLAMHTNWYGLVGDDVQDVLEVLNESELLGGIVGSPTDHHTAPYSLTEEFVSVYRMHALIPDEFTFRSWKTGEVLGTYELPEVSGRAVLPLLDKISPADLLYSFGVMHPGAICLHNYPKHLQALHKDDGTRLDLAALDVLRDRERGVPRYNEFRRLLRKEPVKSFEELTDNPQWREEIRELYGNDLEKVDLMIGLYCEPLPEGFGFSETAFRIFVLMASRRLKSDRFFTNDFRSEVYTPEGFEYIRQNGFASIVQRHHPEVAAALEGVANPFAPWKAVAGAKSKGAGSA